jgi:DUF1680 family protein
MLPAHPQTASATSTKTVSTGPVDATGVLSPLPASALRIAPDSFLGAWQERNNLTTIPHCIDNLESSGVLHNFRRVADGEEGDFIGMWFADSDLYKTLEAVGWESLRLGRPVWTSFLDTALDLIARTQDTDGYINTHVQGDLTKTRWSNLVWSHELYCAGHLFQAAVALSRGAQDDRLLTIALRLAARIAQDLQDRPEAFDGHAEIETALVELARHTGLEDLLHLAQEQVERRGHGRLPKDRFSSEYFGDHLPFREADEATGHAVRQIYFATGLVDLHLEDGDPEKLAAAVRLWDSAYSRKTYVTGGQGSRHTDESFGDDYELPPDRAYTETCAAIASFHWNWRMLLATGDGRYAEQMEIGLYNTIAASVDDDGCHFFYTNPLQMRTGHMGARENSPSERLSWFECACCPPNLARLVASLDDYFVTSTEQGLQMHLLTAGTLRTAVLGHEVTVDVTTGYPWNGEAQVTVVGDVGFEIALRIPGARALRDGRVVAASGEDGYLRLAHAAGTTEVFAIVFDMEAVVIRPHPRIDAIRGTLAVKRGPFVYCLEGVDNETGSPLEDLRIVEGSAIAEVESALPSVEVALSAAGVVEDPDGPLYGQVASTTRPVTITAIPYFAWGNRGPSAMRVWIPVAPAPAAAS